MIVSTAQRAITLCFLALLLGCSPDTGRVSSWPPQAAQTAGAGASAGLSGRATEVEDRFILDEALQQRPAPPPGVKAELAIYGGGVGGGVCTSLDPATPTIVSLSVSELEMGYSVWICATGVVPDLPIEVSVIRPDQIREQFQAESLEGLTWYASPDKPYGEYRVEVRQGERAASAAFVVRRSSRPRVIVEPFRVTRGTTVTVYLTGFPPKREIDLHVYTNLCPPDSNHGCAIYLTTLPKIMINDFGDAITQLKTSNHTRIGAYTLIHNLLPVDEQDMTKTFMVE